MKVIPFEITGNRIKPATPLPSGSDVLGIIGGGDAYYIYYKTPEDTKAYNAKLADIKLIMELNKEEAESLLPEHPEDYAEQ